MKVAIYVRVSREDLHNENQLFELERYAKAQGWDYTIFQEQESTRKTRPIKQDLFNRACKREFDTILVYKLDRWARSLQELINDLSILKQHNVQVIMLKNNLILDSSPQNMLMIHLLGAFAEFERELIRERTIAGLERAKAQGKRLGRPPKNTLPKKEVIFNSQNGI